MKNSQLLCESDNSNSVKTQGAGVLGEPARRAERALPLVMLLGRKDEPTDAIRDYLSHLSEALEGQGIACQTCEMRWDERGWALAIAGLWKQSRAWRGRWVVLHYTALMWSRRGFPLVAPLLLKMLELRGCRTVVVFHDLYAVANSRWIDRFRLFLQKRTMRHLAVNVRHLIVPVAPQCISWLPSRLLNCEFIPVGANVPSLEELREIGSLPARSGMPTVAVFGIPTWPAAQKREVAAIVESVRTACLQTGELQLIVLGRGSKEAEPLLRAGFAGTSVRLRVEDVRDGADISARLCSSDVLLFVRCFSTRRGSGVAAIACGLPVVAYRGEETGSPLTEAGVVFVPQDDVESLGNELARVLLDRELRLHLSERNLDVFRDWFSWDRIADRWIAALGLADEELRK